jgi:hypothetical protein
MSAKVLFQLQLSTYTSNGQFILTADSNWQMFVTKMINMIKIDPNIVVDVLIPKCDSIEDPEQIIDDLKLQENVNLIRIPIAPNALQTRFDFPFDIISKAIDIKNSVYTHVYINDPMLLRHYKALFYLAKKQPKFILQTHFLDSPIARIVDDEVSYWLGTVEAVSKADIALWHCNSMYDVFENALHTTFKKAQCDKLMKKCDVWKDGYSIDEIRKPIDYSNIRFDITQFDGKTIVWVPNRIGGLGKSFDYTNNGKFLFEIVPELWKQRQDFVVIAGNPNQKIPNSQIKELCPAYHYFDFGAVNRDEYRWISQRADIVVGLYENDTNGGLASLESIEFSAVPLFCDLYEYKHYFDVVGWPQHLRVSPGLQDCAEKLSLLIDEYKTPKIQTLRKHLQIYIQQYAAYEYTTRPAMVKLGLI